jgi:hypothetical protein
MRIKVFDGQQFVWQRFAETLVNFANTGASRRMMLQSARVNPALDFEVRFRFVLEISLIGIPPVIILQSLLNIDRMRIMPFDQIRIISIDGAD